MLVVAAAVWIVLPVGPPGASSKSPNGSLPDRATPSATASNGADGLALPTVAAPAKSPMPWAKAEPGRPALEPVAATESGKAAPRSPLADALHRADKSGTEDIRVVYSLLSYYRKAFGSFPTGEDNRQIVNALTGNNPKGLAILPRDHPAINVAGELVDRWQTPFFFHIISRENVEVRSAGEDREMWTTDDLLEGQMEEGSR